MERVGRIKPEYVWITSGTGRWTNEKSAEALAKREAGIDKFKLIKVLSVDNNPVKVIGKEEFIKKASSGKYAYMYGDMVQVREGESMTGEISLISTETWSGIAYELYAGDKKETPYAHKRVVSEFELHNKDISPPPLTRVEHLTREDPYTNTCVIVAAMIIGEPQ